LLRLDDHFIKVVVALAPWPASKLAPSRPV
jgi:hypothetical protein